MGVPVRMPERERFLAQLVDRERVDGLQARFLSAGRVHVFREQVQRRRTVVPVPCKEMWGRGLGEDVAGRRAVGVHVHWGTGAHAWRRGAGHPFAFVEGRWGAFGAGWGDGDGVGVVGGGYGVALEVVDEAGLGGDGDVDCIEEQAV